MLNLITESYSKFSIQADTLPPFISSEMQVLIVLHYFFFSTSHYNRFQCCNVLQDTTSYKSYCFCFSCSISALIWQFRLPLKRNESLEAIKMEFNVTTHAQIYARNLECLCSSLTLTFQFSYKENDAVFCINKNSEKYKTNKK